MGFNVLPDEHHSVKNNGFNIQNGHEQVGDIAPVVGTSPVFKGYPPAIGGFFAGPGDLETIAFQLMVDLGSKFFFHDDRHVANPFQILGILLL